MARLQAATLIWFRLDLRLEDNPALDAACRRGGPIIPVFVWSPDEEAPWSPGAASRWWLHHSLIALQDSLAARGSRLIIRRAAKAGTALGALRREAGADAIFWNRRYEPAVMARDRDVERDFSRQGVLTETFNSALLFEPSDMANRQGKPFQVFTPFWRACLSRESPPEPGAAPRRLPRVDAALRSVPISTLNLLPTLDWADGLRATWSPGERGGADRLARLTNRFMARYASSRDIPADEGTSRLSPHLHFGEISPRRVWHAFGGIKSSAKFLSELGWREFAHHLLVHFPNTPLRPLRPEFARFPWRSDRSALRAWQRGRTGYPIVDAGMRELWATGWMHNRVRMIVASFLVKDLLIPWQAGAKWFWDTLVDADLANNTLGWQWSAGCGADAAPFFRIFNPVAQGERFDADGDYVRRWVPELAGVPNAWSHHPWDCPPDAKSNDGSNGAIAYPSRIVAHDQARTRALKAFERIRRRWK